MGEAGHTDGAPAGSPAPRRRRTSGWYALLAIQFLAVLWPPVFNRVEPSWLGMPFFYWYQLAWVILGGLCTMTVYLLTRD